MDLIVQVVTTLVLLILGWTVGRVRERKHIADLARREGETRHFRISDLKSFPGGADASRESALVTGEAVIASDYLKTFASGLRNLLGGELKHYERLMDRSRREATLRMLEAAAHGGYDAVCNVRLETANIGGGNKARGMPMAVVLVSGTAYRAAPA